jgi:hypothetical protein
LSKSLKRFRENPFKNGTKNRLFAVHLLTARNAEQNRIDTGDFLFAGHLPKEKPRPSHDGRGFHPLENYLRGEVL